MDEHAAAFASLEATVEALKDATNSGFKGVNLRLDVQNDRLRKVENKATGIRSEMVTTKECEDVRKDRAREARATWKGYVIPVAVALTVLVLTKFIG